MDFSPQSILDTVAFRASSATNCHEDIDNGDGNTIALDAHEGDDGVTPPSLRSLTGQPNPAPRCRGVRGHAPEPRGDLPTPAGNQIAGANARVKAEIISGRSRSSGRVTGTDPEPP